MLSISQTMDGIVKRLAINKKAHREVYEVKRTDKILVLGASCIELGRESLGRLIVKNVKELNYHRRPSTVSFEINGASYGTFCDPSEVLIICKW